MYPTKKLSEISNFYNKGVLPKEGQFYNYVGLENIESDTGRLIDFTETEGKKIKSNKVEFKKGMVLYGKLRPYLNKVLIADFDGVATTEILPIECGKDLYNGYLSYFLRTPSFVALANGNISGARMPRVSPKFLKEEVFIPLPPLSTQSRIVAHLDSAFASIDEQISLLRANITDVENIRKSVLEESFQNGESSNIFLGDKEYIEIIDGDRGVNYPKKSEFTESGFCLFLNTSNVRQGFFDFSKMDFITEEKYNKMGKGKAYKNDVILTTRGTIGNSAFVENNFPYDNIRINSGMVILRNNLEKVSPKYLIHFINSPLFEDQKEKFTSGSAQPQLPITVMKRIFIPLPPLPRQHEIVAHLDRVFAETDGLRGEYKAQIRDLQILKQSLLEEAFAGRLVGD